jgi:hypothetical protein
MRRVECEVKGLFSRGKLVEGSLYVFLVVFGHRNDEERRIRENARTGFDALKSEAAKSFARDGANLVVLVVYKSYIHKSAFALFKQLSNFVYVPGALGTVSFRTSTSWIVNPSFFDVAIESAASRSPKLANMSSGISVTFSAVLMLKRKHSGEFGGTLGASSGEGK